MFGLFPAAIVISQGLMLSRQGVSLRAFALPAVLIGLVITPYVTLRPQALSWLLLSLLVWFLLELKPEKPWRALLLVPFFVLWANLHGVYVIGLGVVATYCLFTILGRTPMARRSDRWRSPPSVPCWPPWSPRPARSGSSIRSATWSSLIGAWRTSRSGSHRPSTSRRTGHSWR